MYVEGGRAIDAIFRKQICMGENRCTKQGERWKREKTVKGKIWSGNFLEMEKYLRWDFVNGNPGGKMSRECDTSYYLYGDPSRSHSQPAKIRSFPQIETAEWDGNSKPVVVKKPFLFSVSSASFTHLQLPLWLKSECFLSPHAGFTTTIWRLPESLTFAMRNNRADERVA